MEPAVSKRRLTKQQKVVLVIAGILAIIGISIAAVQRGEDAAIEKNGIEARAVSTGQYMQTRDGGRRSHTVYKAQYSYEVDGRKHFVYGEKLYSSQGEITEGRAVTVKYMPDEVTKSMITSEE